MKWVTSLFLAVLPLCSADEFLVPLISPQQIDGEVRKAASQLNQDYVGKKPKIVMVMKGAIPVTADLIRCLDIPFTLDYVKASSYGQNGEHRGELTIKGLESLDVEDQDILVIDDIFDTGSTMKGVVERLQEKHPKSLKTLVLLMKDVDRTIDYRPDYVLFHIKNHFVVGYGLDYKEYYRGLPGIFYFKDDRPPREVP